MMLPTDRARCPCLFIGGSLLVLLAGLAGCASTTETPSAPQPAPARSPEDVELTLSLPEPAPGCDCAAFVDDSDRTFLERGVAVLAEGDHIEAVQYFQRYQRLEQAPLAQWEAQLAIAYVSMLPNSPFYDVDAARRSYAALRDSEPAGQKHHSIVLMRQALETFVLMERHVQDAENRARVLQEDLEKREQALRRLRELTLGQPAGER